MKRHFAVFLVWATVYIAALWANLGSFWMGDGAALEQLGVTALYGLVCLTFLWLRRNSRRWMQHSFFWGIAAVLGGVFCLLARRGVPWAAIPGLLLGGALFTPFYGLTFLDPLGDWDEFYGVMLALSVIWAVISGCLLLRGRRNDGEKE